MRSTLKSSALSKVTEKARSLGEVVRLCEDEDTLQDSCKTSGEFWRGVISKFIGQTLVEQRGDLQTDLDWYYYAKSLASGSQFLYCALLRGDEWKTIAEPFYGSVRHRENQGDHRYRFVIPGMLPRKGTSGFLIIMTTEEKTFTEIFLVGTDVKKSLRYACESLATEYHDYLHESSEGGYVAFSHDNMPDDDAEMEPILPSSYFADYLYDQYSKQRKTEGEFFAWYLDFPEGLEQLERVYAIWYITPVTF